MAKKAYIGVDGVARKIKKGYIGVENFVPRALPSGYTQASYIQSSGTQYVDTGFKPNQDTRVVMDAQILKDPGTSVAIYFGVRWDGGFFELYKAGSSANLTFLYNTTYSQYFTVDYTLRRTVEINKNTATVDGVTKSYPAGTFQSNLPLFLCADNEYGAEKSHTAMRLYSCQIYDNGTLVRDYVPCTNASGTAGLYDLVGAKFYANAGSGAFAAGSSASSVARKIKKAYIGIGGVARPCWSGGELAYYGTVTSLYEATYDGAAGTVDGTTAIFSGGKSTHTTSIYDSSLTLKIGGTMEAIYLIGAAAVGDYLIFGCGRTGTSSSSGYSSATYAVDKYGSATTSSPLFATVRAQYAATTVGNYALFGGGVGSGAYYALVDSFNASLTRGTATSLNTKRVNLAATTVGDYALFGGGNYGSSYYATVDVYNTSLTHSVATDLSKGRAGLKATTVGNYALFGGGHKSSSTTTGLVDAYDKSLTLSRPTGFTSGTYRHSATTVNGYALFGGGTYAHVYAYDESLSMTKPTGLSSQRDRLAATTVGNYALFGGGYHSSAGAVVDAYTVA